METRRMWLVLAAWLICLASLSLPWPGIILVVLLCCVAFFELASPAAWVAITRQQHNSRGTKNSALPANLERPSSGAGRSGSRLTAMARAFHEATDRLRGGGGGGGGKTEGRKAAVDAVGASEKQPKPKARATTVLQAPATFLKGSVGSFSRGGLMITNAGRVIYKVNQDRGLISHPSLNRARHTVFGVFDGHGENGEQVAAYTMREVPRRLALHPDAIDDPTSALEDIFLDINASLPKSGINAVFGGCTAVVALVRGLRVWVANAGDSRALVARKGEDGDIVAHGLTRDQNPDSPGERERIEGLGGFVSDPEEVGASARVWLDETRTMVGLAMARSIGDLAVKRVGVIALPEVTEYELTPQDEFLVLASDGIWEFIDNQEAAEVVQRLLDAGEDAAGACKGLMELANRRWSDMVGDYRDDITATVVRLPFLPPSTAATAVAVNVGAERRNGKATLAASGTGEEEDDAGQTDDDSGPLLPCADEKNINMRKEREDSSLGTPRTSAVEAVDANAVAAASVAAASGSGGVNGSPASLLSELDGGAAAGVDDAVVGPLKGAGAAATAAATGTAPAPASDNDVLNSSASITRLSTVIEGDAEVASDVTLTPTTTTPEGESEDDVGDDGDVVRGHDVDGGGPMDEDGTTTETARMLLAISDALGATTDAAVVASSSSAGVDTAATDSTAGAAAAAALLPEANPLIQAPAALQASMETDVDGSKEVDLGMMLSDDEEEEEDDEEWEWDFGARDCREPSREMREASREFSSGSLDALVAGIDSCET